MPLRLPGHASAPELDRFVLRRCTLPNPAFGLDDPVDLAVSSFLNDHPIGVVEAPRPAGLQIIDAEQRPGFPLFGSTKSRKPEYVFRCLVQEHREAPFKVVVGGHVVEDGLGSLQGWQVTPPMERRCFRQTEVRFIKLYRPPFDREFGDLAGEVFGDAFLEFRVK